MPKGQIHTTHIHRRKSGETLILKNEVALAQLSDTERRAVADAFAALMIKERELRVMRAGYNSVWAELRSKYSLPSEFDYDSVAGNVRRRAPKGE